MERTLWETSGHWETYHANMFVTETEDARVFALKPMNCPGHVQIYKHGLKSYRDLPLKIAEFGCVHRYEPSGALHGLMRVRAFTQDDAHIFCTEDQIAEQCLDINRFMLSIYKDFGFEDIHIKLATRPEKRVGADRAVGQGRGGDEGRARQIGAASDGRIKTSIAEGEGAFYGPKFEYHLRDAIGRTWQCGTTQVDFNLPSRFGAFFIDSDGEKKTPVMIHRAMFGSLERFTGIYLENTAGHLPLWASPVQAVVATIVSDADEYAGEVTKRAAQGGPARRNRPAEREDQLQGARAFLEKDPGDGGRRQARGRGAQSLDPPPRLRQKHGDDPGRGGCRAHVRSRPSGSRLRHGVSQLPHRRWASTAPCRQQILLQWFALRRPVARMQ